MDGMSQDTHWYRMGIPTTNNDQIQSGPQRAPFPPPSSSGGDRRHHLLNNNNNNNGYINHLPPPIIPIIDEIPTQLSLQQQQQQQQPPPPPPNPTPNEDANAPYPPPNLPQFYPPPPHTNSHSHPPPPPTNQFNIPTFNQPPPGYPFYPTSTVSSNPQQFFTPFPNGNNAQNYQQLTRPPRPGSFGYSMPNGGYLIYDSLPGQPELSQGPYYSIWKPDRLIQYNSDITYPTTIFPNPHQYSNPEQISLSSASNNYYGPNNNNNNNNNMNNNNSNKITSNNNNQNQQNNRLFAVASNVNFVANNNNNNRRSNNSFRGRHGVGPARGPGRPTLRRLKHNDVIDLTDDCDETNNATAGPSSSSSSSFSSAQSTVTKSSPPSTVVQKPTVSASSSSLERVSKNCNSTNSASLIETKQSVVAKQAIENLEIGNKPNVDVVRAELQKNASDYFLKNGLTNFFRLLYELSPVDEFRIIAQDYLDCMDAYLFPRPSSIRDLCFIIRKFVQTFKRFIKYQMYEYIIMEFFHYNMKIFSTCIEYCPFFKHADKIQYLTEIMEAFRIYFTSIETYLIELDKGVERVMREKPKLSALAANQKYLKPANSLNWEKPDPEFLYLKRGRPGPIILAQRLISLLLKLSLGRLDCIYTILLKTMLKFGGKNTSVFYETVYRHFLVTIPKIVALNRPLTELDRYRLFCVWKFFTGKVRGKSRDTMNEALRSQFGSESKFAGNNQMILRCLDRYLADLEKFGSSFARDYFEIFEDDTRELLDSNDTVTIISKFSWLSVDVEDHHSIVSLEQINRRVQLRRNYYEFTGKSVNNEELTSPHFLHRSIPHVVVYYPQISRVVPEGNDEISCSNKENKLVDGDKLYFIPDVQLYVRTKLSIEQESKILAINDSATISTFNFNNFDAELSSEEFNKDSWELINEMGMINLAAESTNDNEEITSWNSWMELTTMEINSSPKLIEMETLPSSQKEISNQISSENFDDDLVMMMESEQVPAVVETSENVLKEPEAMKVSLEISEEDVLMEEQNALTIDSMEQICKAKDDLNLDSIPVQVEEIQTEKVLLIEQKAENIPQFENIQPILNDIIEPVNKEEIETAKLSCVELNVNDKIVQTEEVSENITQPIVEEFIIPLAPFKMDEKLTHEDKPEVQIEKVPENIVQSVAVEKSLIPSKMDEKVIDKDEPKVQTEEVPENIVQSPAVEKILIPLTHSKIDEKITHENKPKVQTKEVPENNVQSAAENFLIPSKIDEKVIHKYKPKVLVSINKEILKIPSKSPDLKVAALLNTEKSSLPESEEPFQKNVAELINEEKMIKHEEETPTFVEEPRKVRKRPKTSNSIKTKRSKKSKPNKMSTKAVTFSEPIIQQKEKDKLEEEKTVVVVSNQQKGLVVLEQVIIKPIEEKAKFTCPESHILEPINLINHQEPAQSEELVEEVGFTDSKSLMPSSLQDALALKPVLFEEFPVDVPNNNLTTPVNLKINKDTNNIDIFESYDEWEDTVLNENKQTSSCSKLSKIQCESAISAKLLEVAENEITNNDLIIEDDFEENSSGSIPSPQKEPLESSAELREYFPSAKEPKIRQITKDHDAPLSFGINSILSSPCSIATSPSLSITPDHLVRRSTPILISSSFDHPMLHHQSDINTVVESASIIEQQPVKEFYDSIRKEVVEQETSSSSSSSSREGFARNFINLVSPGVDPNDAISLQCRMMMVKQEEPLTSSDTNKLMHSPLSYQQYEVMILFTVPIIKPIITPPARNVTFFEQKIAAEHHHHHHHNQFNSYNKAIRENSALRRSSRVKPAPIIADNMHESYSNRRNVAENVQTHDFIPNQQHLAHHHHHGVVQRSILKKPKRGIRGDQIGLKELYSDCPTNNEELSLDYNNLTNSSQTNNNLIINNNSPEIAVRNNTNRFYQNNNLLIDMNLITNNLHQQETQYLIPNAMYDTNLPSILQLQREEYEEEERKLINNYNNLYNNNGDSLINIPNNNLVVEEPRTTTTTTTTMLSSTATTNNSFNNHNINESTYFTHNNKRPLIKNPKYSPNQDLFMAAKAQLPPKKRKLTEDEELAILIEKIKEEQHNNNNNHHHHQPILVNNPTIIHEETVSYPAQRQMSIADLDEAFPKVRTLAAKKFYPELLLNNNDDSLNSLVYPVEERYYNEYRPCDDQHQQQPQQLNNTNDNMNKIMIGTFISNRRGVVECCSAEYPLCVMIDTMNPCVHHHHHHHISSSADDAKTVVLPSSSPPPPPPVQNLTAQRRKSTRKIVAASVNNNKFEPSSSSVLQQSSLFVKRGRGRPRKNP